MNYFEFLLLSPWLFFVGLSRLRSLAQIFDEEVIKPHRIRPLYVLAAWMLSSFFAFKFKNLPNHANTLLVMCYYNILPLGVTQAFRLRGRDVYDVQHGYIGLGHSPYSNLSKKLNSKLYPTGFIDGSDMERQFLSARLPNADIAVTDFMHLNVKNRKAPNPTTKQKKSALCILFTLDHPYVEIPDKIGEVIHNTALFQWRIRPHPLGLNANDPTISKIRSFHWVDFSSADVSLLDDLKNCDIHLTSYSSTVYEAAELGKFSLYFGQRGIGRFIGVENAGLTNL